MNGQKDSKKVTGRTRLAVFPPVGHFCGVNNESFADATLVVLGHGTDLNDQSATPTRLHASELKRRQIFAKVVEAFWKQAPRIQDVLAQAASRRVFIAPLFISEGYFADQVIPAELGFGDSRLIQEPGRELHYCRPVGTHESMTKLILSRAVEVTRSFPFPRLPKPSETTLFVAGHGTEKNAKSRAAIDRQVELIRSQGLYADVQAIFMEQDPRIEGCAALARTRNCVVVPFFISAGLHVQEDIPVLLGEPAATVKARLKASQPTWRNPTEKAGKLFWYAAPVGTDPGLADVILERVAEAAARTTASGPA
jgi:sirohydrochlorin cobaltochelatase